MTPSRFNHCPMIHPGADYIYLSILGRSEDGTGDPNEVPAVSSASSESDEVIFLQYFQHSIFFAVHFQAKGKDV